VEESMWAQICADIPNRDSAFVTVGLLLWTLVMLTVVEKLPDAKLS